jgi:hypothetical protein
MNVNTISRPKRAYALPQFIAKMSRQISGPMGFSLRHYTFDALNLGGDLGVFDHMLPSHDKHFLLITKKFKVLMHVTFEPCLPIMIMSVRFL